MNRVRTIAAAVPLSFLGIAAIAALFTLTACNAISIERISSSGQQSQAVADAKGLAVESRNGSISVVQDDEATELQVTAHIRCGGATKEEADKRLAESKIVTEKLSDGVVRVTVSIPPLASGKARASNDGANIEVRAAALNGITLTTSNGGVQCAGFEGKLCVKSSNGKITVANHRGQVEADTSNGAIEAKNVAGPVDLQTSNGSVELVLADGSTQNVEVRSSNGKLSVNLPAAWGGVMNAQTSNGGVTLRADPGRAGLVKSSRNSCTANISGGDGSASAVLRTSNGPVVVTVRGSGETPATPEEATEAPEAVAPASESKASM